MDRPLTQGHRDLITWLAEMVVSDLENETATQTASNASEKKELPALPIERDAEGRIRLRII